MDKLDFWSAKFIYTNKYIDEQVEIRNFHSIKIFEVLLMIGLFIIAHDGYSKAIFRCVDVRNNWQISGGQEIMYGLPHWHNCESTRRERAKESSSRDNTRL